VFIFVDIGAPFIIESWFTNFEGMNEEGFQSTGFYGKGREG